MNSKKSFTLIEAMVSASILLIVLAGVFLLFNFGQTQSPISLDQTAVKAKTRIIINRLVYDLRHAVTWDIANNNPSCSYLKFRKLKGIDTADGSYYFSSNYIEYSYDKEANLLQRLELDEDENILGEVIFENVTEDVFYIFCSQEGLVCLNAGDLLSESFIIVNIKIEKPKRMGHAIEASSTQRITMRND